MISYVGAGKMLSSGEQEFFLATPLAAHFRIYEVARLNAARRLKVSYANGVLGWPGFSDCFRECNGTPGTSVVSARPLAFEVLPEGRAIRGHNVL